MFEVKVMGSPQPKLTWYHGDEKVVVNNYIHVTKDGSLILPSVEDRHGGLYQLVAENTAGAVEREFELQVVKKSKFLSLPTQSEKEFAAVPAAMFGDHVESKHSDNNKGFFKEYEV